MVAEPVQYLLMTIKLIKAIVKTAISNASESAKKTMVLTFFLGSDFPIAVPKKNVESKEKMKFGIPVTNIQLIVKSIPKTFPSASPRSCAVLSNKMLRKGIVKKMNGINDKTARTKKT